MGRVGACGVDDRAEAHRVGEHRIWVTSEKGIQLQRCRRPGPGIRISRAAGARGTLGLISLKWSPRPPTQGGGAHRVGGTVVHQAQKGRTLADSKRWI
jgi:hypothetical protein